LRERIRDKFAASKRKGLWVGGIAPLGYETQGPQDRVVEEEAERVRTIFQRYLELGSLNRKASGIRAFGPSRAARFTRGDLARAMPKHPARSNIQHRNTRAFPLTSMDENAPTKP
jgi:DNA invertase Pin-like site-specific DNA recombinase